MASAGRESTERHERERPIKIIKIDLPESIARNPHQNIHPDLRFSNSGDGSQDPRAQPATASNVMPNATSRMVPHTSHASFTSTPGPQLWQNPSNDTNEAMPLPKRQRQSRSFDQDNGGFWKRGIAPIQYGQMQGEKPGRGGAESQTGIADALSGVADDLLASPIVPSGHGEQTSRHQDDASQSAPIFSDEAFARIAGLLDFSNDPIAQYHQQRLAPGATIPNHGPKYSRTFTMREAIVANDVPSLTSSMGLGDQQSIATERKAYSAVSFSNQPGQSTAPRSLWHDQNGNSHFATNLATRGGFPLSGPFANDSFIGLVASEGQQRRPQTHFWGPALADANTANVTDHRNSLSQNRSEYGRSSTSNTDPHRTIDNPPSTPGGIFHRDAELSPIQPTESQDEDLEGDRSGVEDAGLWGALDDEMHRGT